MEALMFYYNQCYIQVLECFLMFFALRQNNIPLIWRRDSLCGSHAVQYAFCYGIRMFNSPDPRKPKAISH